MEISSLGRHKFRRATAGTNAFFSILCIFFKFYEQIGKLLSQFPPGRSYIACGCNYNFSVPFSIY